MLKIYGYNTLFAQRKKALWCIWEEPDYGIQYNREYIAHCRLRYTRSVTYLSFKCASSKKSQHRANLDMHRIFLSAKLMLELRCQVSLKKRCHGKKNWLMSQHLSSKKIKLKKACHLHHFFSWLPYAQTIPSCFYMVPFFLN